MIPPGQDIEDLLKQALSEASADGLSREQLAAALAAELAGGEALG